MNSTLNTTTRGRAGFASGSLALLTGLALISPVSAYAYVDPGTGTVLWQLLLGLIVGVGFYSRKILGWFTGKR